MIEADDQALEVAGGAAVSPSAGRRQVEKYSRAAVGRKPIVVPSGDSHVEDLRRLLPSSNPRFGSTANSWDFMQGSQHLSFAGRAPADELIHADMELPEVERLAHASGSRG